MESKNQEIRVGLTVILALALLIFGIIWGKEYALTAKRVSFDIVFANSSGLDVGDPVTVLGVKKGKVKDIQIVGDKVRVTVTIDEDVNLFQDASAHIKSLELMSGKCVELFPGLSGQSLNLKTMSQPLQGVNTLGLEDMGALFGDLYADTRKALAKLDTALTVVNSILSESGMKSSIQNAINDIDTTSNELKKILRLNKVHIEKSLANLDTSSSIFKKIITSRETEIDSSLQRLDLLSQNLLALSVSAREMTRRISNGEGSLGKLVNDEDTYERLTRTVASLDSLTTDLKSHLGEYLKGADFNLLTLFNF